MESAMGIDRGDNFRPSTASPDGVPARALTAVIYQLTTPMVRVRAEAEAAAYRVTHEISDQEYDLLVRDLILIMSD